MRNFTPALRGEKFYTSSLTLCGEKVLLVEPENRRRTRFHNKNLNLLLLDGAVGEGTTFLHQKTRKSQGKVQIPVKVHTTDYKNPQVCSKELRQIYQTKEVNDFKKIFQQLYKSKLFLERFKYSNDVVLSRLNPEEIYEEHFNQHYGHLTDLIQIQC